MESPPVIRDESPLQPGPLRHGDDARPSTIEMAKVFTRSWGPFLGFLASVVALSFISLQLARTDTVAVVIGVIAVVAIVVAYLSNKKAA